PRVLRVPLGTLVADAAPARGPASVALAGALRGPLLDGDDVVTTTTSGLLVLPVAHALVHSRRERPGDELARARSACTSCRVCTDTCPPALRGAPLAPDRVLAALSHLPAEMAAAASGALYCTGCGL